MFNFGPSPMLMKRMLPGFAPQQPEGPPPTIGTMPEGMPMPPDMGGGMPIDVGSMVKFPGMDQMPMPGGPRMPRIIDGPMPGMPPGMVPPMNPGPMQPPMQGGGGGFMGKIRDAAKRVAGGIQGKPQPQGKGFAARFKNMTAAAAPEAAKLLQNRRRPGY